MAYNANSQFHFDANLPSDSTQWLIVEPVYQAVMQRRRAPNTKSSESKLCAIFGVGCMHVRRALLLLRRRALSICSQIAGAYVAFPDAAEANEVFDARMLVEPFLARK